MKKLALPGLIAFALLAVSLFAVTPAGAAEDDSDGPLYVFDMAHKEIFSPVKGGELDYSEFAAMLKKEGRVETNTELLTPALLRGVDAYILAAPSQELTVDDIAVLRSYVRLGGDLLILVHIAPPVARLAESFGILTSNFIVAEGENTIGGEVQDFMVKDFNFHPVTEGLGELAFYGSWALKAQGQGWAVASTSDKAWADLNRNRVKDEGEPAASFGVIAVSRLGGGKVVVVADDAPFANKFIDEADNRKLAENIIRWFAE